MLYRRTRRLRLQEIYVLQDLADQVVFAVEQTFAMAGWRKKKIARQVLRQMLADQRLFLPAQTLEVAIEAAVRLMNLMEEVAA